MASASNVVLPRRRSLAVWALLAVAMVVVSYLFIVALAASCVYLPYLLLTRSDTANLQILVLFLVGVAMAGTMLWSLLPRRDHFVPPGPLLERSAHPRLFSELDRIAAWLHEPVPSEVYLIPDVNAWVTDRGGILGVGGRRVMGLGLPLVSILTVSEFRAILAHEFAHYYGGDTRLGPWVYKTRMAMARTIDNLGSISGIMRWWIAALVYRLVMWILVSYWKLYFRCTQIISRRQEYRADELACHLAGQQALCDGLKKINGAGVVFPSFIQAEIAPNLNNGLRLPICEGFVQFVAAPNVSRGIEQYLDKLYKEQKVEPYDSHPPLRDRLKAAQGMPPRQGQPEDTAFAATLFENVVAEEARLLQMLGTGQDISQLKLIHWEDLQAATILQWKETMGQFAGILGETTAETIPEALERLPEMGRTIPDPPGMLLTPQQRAGRAVELLAIGMGLTLVEAGWSVHMKPGDHRFRLGNEQVSVWQMLDDLLKKNTTATQWRDRCRSLRLPTAPFASLALNNATVP
jgi:Zn-dependent protease with chaperone function